MATIKAGCYLIDVNRKMIALIHREKQNDYSFPKGHVEDGEDIMTAAIRETAEETKRIAVIVEEFEPHLEEYVTPKGEECACFMFIAIDGGKSDNDSTDTHEVVWTPFEDVENVLTYPSLKTSWGDVKENIKKVMDNN
ncbi:MAG: NUDIX domain-containing protein [Clostridiales bacterium]|nr:NUDIX domain-containing protein [Clostridiales bacterium]